MPAIIAKTAVESRKIASISFRTLASSPSVSSSCSSIQLWARRTTPFSHFSAHSLSNGSRCPAACSSPLSPSTSSSSDDPPESEASRSSSSTIAESSRVEDPAAPPIPSPLASRSRSKPKPSESIVSVRLALNRLARTFVRRSTCTSESWPTSVAWKPPWMGGMYSSRRIPIWPRSIVDDSGSRVLLERGS